MADKKQHIELDEAAALVESAIEHSFSLATNRVSMSNDAARAAHGFSLTEKRLFTAAISQIDSRPNRMHAGAKTLHVSAQQYADTFGIDPKIAYRDLKRAADNIFERYISVRDGKKVTRIRWIDRSTYHDGEGWVAITFSDSVMPHLYELTHRFTSYKLSRVSALRSLYAWRLMEYLYSYMGDPSNDPGKMIVDLEDLRFALEIPASYRFTDIKRRVLESSCKEIEKSDSIIIDWTPIKRGKKVKKIEFTWRLSIQAILNFEANEKTNHE
ncbi:replication initiation protein [Phytohalomonas tamaricis]|uniref:replication initiation protein n=1 Tax=Phytohalomonas tamaricis TaxID=2081032 RepID=UPI000D0B1FCF|nr:replication initiation protein [Phytohalomonas tamaricis]